MTTPQPLIALVNGRVLADHGPQDGLAVLVRGGHIEAMTHADDPRVAGAKRHDLKGRLLLPGFIDVQVNGGGGVLFNAEPTVDALRTISAAHRKFGTTGFLPTLITDTADVMHKALDGGRCRDRARRARRARHPSGRPVPGHRAQGYSRRDAVPPAGCGGCRRDHRVIAVAW